MIQESSNNIWNQAKYFWNRRELVFVWTKFNLLASYSETRLGLVWIFLQPLFISAVYTVAFSHILGARPARGTVPFLPFYLSGTVPWQLFNDSIMQSTQVVVSNMGLMTQVRFPREATVFVAFFERLVDFSGALLVTILILSLNGIYPNLNYIFLIPWIIIISFFSLGIMFILSSIGVFIRDLPNILSPLMRFLFFMSGVIFSLNDLSETYQTILRFNPLIWIIEGVRNILLFNEPPNPLVLGIFFLGSILIFCFGYWFFKSKEAVFTEHL